GLEVFPGVRHGHALQSESVKRVSVTVAVRILRKAVALSGADAPSRISRYPPRAPQPGVARTTALPGVARTTTLPGVARTTGLPGVARETTVSAVLRESRARTLPGCTARAYPPVRKSPSTCSAGCSKCPAAVGASETP